VRRELATAVAAIDVRIFQAEGFDHADMQTMFVFGDTEIILMQRIPSNK
jgi:hypothetical protein